MAESSFTFKRRNVLACGVAFAMAASMSVPAAAFGEGAQDAVQPVAVDLQPDSESPDVLAIDKGEAYQEAPVSSSPIALFSYSYTRITPMDISDNMKYFTLYESGRNYDQGFSYGDGYHAMGYYQFDNRYSLQDFMQGCYWYDPDTFSMFKWATDSSIDLSSVPMAVNGQLTELGKRAQDSWHAAYAAAPKEFSQLQDGYAYTNYYLPAENYLRSKGIEISDRNDAVKGLSWGLCVLFGSGGMRTYFDSANLTNDMTDVQFVTNVCNSVIDNVGSHVSNYVSSYQNRYERELATCLSIIGATGDTRAPQASVDAPVSDSGANEGNQAADDDSASNEDSSSAAGGESNAVPPSKPALPEQSGGSDVAGSSSSGASNDAPNPSATDAPASNGPSASDAPVANAPSDSAESPASPGAPSTGGSNASSGATTGGTNEGAAPNGATTENGSSAGASEASGSQSGSGASNGAGDDSKPGKDASDAANSTPSTDPKDPAVVTAPNSEGGDITTLSLNKTVEKGSGTNDSNGAPKATAGTGSSSVQQADVNAPQQAKKLSETNDGMMGLFIAMAAAAVAALAAIGVAVFRMTHRNR